jgi:hypothetical protein
METHNLRDVRTELRTASMSAISSGKMIRRERHKTLKLFEERRADAF